MRYAFTLFVLAVTLTVNSQEFLNWQKFIYGTAEKNDSATAIEVMDDEVMIAGNVNNAGTGLDALINKFNPDGTLIWSGGYFSAFGDEVKSFQCNFHDFTFAVGSTGKPNNRDGLIFELDEDGENVWSKTFKGTYGGNDEFLNLKFTPDNNIIVVGETMASSITCSSLIAEYDEAGNLKWKRTFGTAGENEFDHIEIDDAGNIFVSGYSFNGSNKDGVIAEYDAAGKLIKSITVNGAGNGDDEIKALELENGLLYAAIAGPGGGPHTATIIIAYNPNNFKLAWSQTYGGVNFGFSVAGSFQCNLHGDLLISGTQENGSDSNLAVVSYNALSGSFNWASIIGPEISYNYQAVTNTLDTLDNFIITGTASPAAAKTNSSKDIFTTAVDSKGAIVWTKMYDGISKKDDSPSAIGVNGVGEIFITGQSQLKDENGVTSNDIILLKYSDKEICSTPTSLTTKNIMVSSATLGWDAMPEAVKYKIQYRSKGGAWETINTSKTSKNITGLIPNTQYEWRVKTICSINPMLTSDFSSIKNFITDPGLDASTLNNLKVAIKLFPNPANKLVNIKIEEENEKLFQVEIRDIPGRLIHTQQISLENHTCILDISFLPHGSYFLLLKGEHSNYSAAFIKQ